MRLETQTTVETLREEFDLLVRVKLLNKIDKFALKRNNR